MTSGMAVAIAIAVGWIVRKFGLTGSLVAIGVIAMFQ